MCAALVATSVAKFMAGLASWKEPPPKIVKDLETGKERSVPYIDTLNPMYQRAMVTVRELIEDQQGADSLSLTTMEWNQCCYILEKAGVQCVLSGV